MNSKQKRISTIQKKFILDKVANKFTASESTIVDSEGCTQLSDQLPEKLSETSLRRYYGHLKDKEDPIATINGKNIKTLCKYLGYDSPYAFLETNYDPLFDNIITIRELQYQNQDFIIEIQIGNEVSYKVDIKEINLPDIEDLDWYFKEYIDKPWLAGAKDSVDTINEYGSTLFELLFSSTHAAELRKVIDAIGLDRITFKIIGKSGDFHSILWESLLDNEYGVAYLLGGANFIRSTPKDLTNLSTTETSDTLNMLIVTSRNSWEGDVAYRGIQKPLVETIIRSGLNINFHVLRPGSFKSLVEHMSTKESKYYHIIHFDVHGEVSTYDELIEKRTAGELSFGPSVIPETFNIRFGKEDMPPFEGFKSFLSFENDDTEQMQPYEADYLAKCLKSWQIPICILNACETAKNTDDLQFRPMAQTFLEEGGFQMIVAMRYSITVSAALIWVESFYKHLLIEGHGVEKCASLASRRLANQKSRNAFRDYQIDLEDWFLPVLYSRGKVDLNLKKELNSNKKKELKRKRILWKNYSGPKYGFIGRDLDILKFEKSLINHKHLWLYGTKGVGKTAFLKELQLWWELSNFFNKVFYFSYIDGEPTNEQLIQAVLEDFNESNEDSSLELEELNLSEKKVVFIFDDLQAILKKGEFSSSSNFIDYLIAEEIPIIFCSSNGAFPNNIPNDVAKEGYHLESLDETSTYVLARKIIENQGLDMDLQREESEADFERLIELCGGVPQDLIYVISKLNEMSVEDVLEELETLF